MKNLKKYLVAFVAVALMASCYPGGPSYVEDYDITFASKSDGADFSNKLQNTYVLPDSIIDITDPDNPGNHEDMNPATEQQVLSHINARLTEYGYTKEPDSHRDNVDYAVFATRLTNDNWVTYYWGGGGWCGWYPYWCGGYYPPTTSSYNYETGTLHIMMVDMNTSDSTTGVIDVVWEGGINGLLTGSQTNITNRLSNGVDKMFEMSPYLNKN